LSAAVVHVVHCEQVRQRLATLPAQARLAEQKRTIELRLPLYDEAVAHFLSTYVADWPCRHYPEGWREQAAALCARFGTVRQGGACVAKSSKGRVAELYALLAQCAHDPLRITGREVGRIRRIIDDFVRKYGPPGSNTHRERRTEQRRQVAAPAYHLIARAVSARLSSYPADSGIADFTDLSVPITAEEAHAFGLAKGVTLPYAILRRLKRCRSGTIGELIGYGLITSGESLARVLPAMTAEITSAGFRDAPLRILYAATYRAFRRRRSLLLLNLQSQVALNDLPWIAPVEVDRQSDATSVDAARQALTESSILALAAFPQAILPNKLLQEFRALAKTGAMDLPFVDEVAADIFMASSPASSSRPQDVLRRWWLTLCMPATTTSIPPLGRASRPTGTPDTSARWSGQRIEGDALAKLSAQRANVKLGTWHPATNGCVLEQQQILTTQNLSLLFGDLGLKSLLRPHLGSMARRCFEWICAASKCGLSTTILVW
jgi:hypothetical protein